MRPHLLLFSLLLLLGCKKTATRQELLAYTFEPNNGLCQKEERNSNTIEAIYRPSDLILFQQLNGSTWSSAQIDSLKTYYGRLDYFLLRLSRDGKEITISYAVDPSKFQQVNSYLGFEIGKDVFLVNQSDTIRVLDFIHTRTFGSSPSSDILFAFKSGLKSRSGKVKLVFNDQRFGLGLNEFTFNCSDIKSAPYIDFNK